MTQGMIALGISFILGFFIYPFYISYLEKSTAKQKVSEYALDEFKEKQSTVTFGGLVFVVLPIVVGLLLLNKQVNVLTLLIMGLFLGYGMLGFADDYLIVKQGNNDGVSPKVKLIVQITLATIFYFVYTQNGGNTLLHIPIIHTSIDLKILYLPFVAFMMTAFSNAVNLTDGMDGLATGTSIIAFTPLAYFAFYQDKNLFVFLLAVIGSLIAFLVYNHKPAKIFMGDVGSLALGALFAIASIYLDLEILSIVIGGVFVFETATVLIQQTYYKYTRERIFLYTPIHYSFTMSGWKEIRVVQLFWLIGIICAALGLWLGLI
ncbi:MAG TPA: phospho-N-acetylmuramoyl-pentapeptide-transferase [Erysipelothrix sp.]|nr:phospho-N-acetylmuramoyl-pentapeptide-transferase [Erysipelothrix sp.]